MKAIVANVFGGIFGCLGWINSTMAIPLRHQLPRSPSNLSQNHIFSAKLRFPEGLPANYQKFGSLDRTLTIDQLNSSKSSSGSASDLFLLEGKEPYVHKAEQINLVLGFQNTFWPSTNNQQYWGVTTVEHWGKTNNRGSKLLESDYTKSAPILGLGSSSLTFSGGGNNNLTETSDLDRNNVNSQEFAEFRGGVTYHHGVINQITMGVGFIYENNLAGFTQLTYDSDILPVKTTFSLLAQESEVNLHSHVLFQPTQNFALNYYHDEEKQKFDLNWGIAPDFTLLGRGNSKNESYSAGIKFAIRNDYLSFGATAELDNEHNLQWKFNSQISAFRFIYSNDQRKSSSELNADLIHSQALGLHCSTFVRYQSKLTKAREEEYEEFVVWGGQVNSVGKTPQNKDVWSLELGYGSGIHGKGLIASGSVALQPDLFLKLNYQTISAVSDDTKVKLQLSSQ